MSRKGLRRIAWPLPKRVRLEISSCGKEYHFKELSTDRTG